MMKKKWLLTAILAFALVFSSGCMGETAQSGNSSVGSETTSESQTDNTDGSDSQEGTENDGSDNTDGSEETTDCVVTFDTDGGSEVASVTVKKGEKIPMPTAPQKSSKECEYEFLGWYYEDKAWDFEQDTVTGNMTLTAKWKVESGYTPPFLPKN